MELADELRATAKKLLEEDRIDLFIGYEKGTLPLHTRPCYVNRADDVGRLTWDGFCSNNLAVYLPRLFSKQHRPKDWKPPKVAIVAKGCDGRSIVGLIKEKQVPRENVIILGVPCSGIVDLRKVEAALNGATPVGAESSDDGTVTIHTDAGQDIQLSRDAGLLDSCADCLYPDSPVFDAHIGPQSSSPEQKPSFKDVEDFESKSPQERWQYFLDEMSKCIRCYACRQACPNCYCPTCFAEQTQPKWLGVGPDIPEVMYYQLGRIFHQAGRCVDCGACVRACPMNIDLRVFTRKMVKDIQELFGYEAGISLDEPLPLRTFTMEDDESFITEP
jgi:formate dehydrogenase (coenzyme F420) beta subunit